MNMNEIFFHLFISFSIHICTTVGWRLRKCFQNMLFCDLGYCALLLNLLIPDFKRAAKHRLELFPLPHPYPYPEFLQVVPLYHKQFPYTTGGHSSLSCPCLQAAPCRDRPALSPLAGCPAHLDGCTPTPRRTSPEHPGPTQATQGAHLCRTASADDPVGFVHVQPVGLGSGDPRGHRTQLCPQP